MTEPLDRQEGTEDDSRNEGASFLENGKMVDMIILLYRNGTTAQNDLRERFGQKATERNLPLLKRLGLAEDYYPPAGTPGYKRRSWRLTRNGMWTGEKLTHIAMLVTGEVVLDELTNDPENYRAPPDVRFGDEV